MKVSDCARIFLSDKRSENRSAKTIRGYQAALDKFCTWAGDPVMSKVTARMIREYIASLQGSGIKSVTVAHYVRPLKVFTRWAVREGEMNVDPFVTVKVPKFSDRLFETIPDEDFEKLLAACDRRKLNGRRDYAILLFLMDTGVRVSELTGLRTADVDLTARVASVVGKGDKERKVFFVPRTAAAMVAYRTRLEARLKFTPSNFFVTDEARPMTDHTVRLLLRRLTVRSGVQSRVHPHAFRHSFATSFLNEGGDLESLRRLLGHSSLEIVRKYTHLTTKDLQAKHDLHSRLALPPVRLAP